MTDRCSRVVSRRHIAPRAPPLPSPPSRCPTSGPPGSATAPPTLSPAAWSSAARACPTPRSTASSTEPVRPRSRVPLFSIRVSCVITPTARPRPRGGGAREPPRSSGIDRSTLVGRRDGDARLARALETAVRSTSIDRMQQRRADGSAVPFRVALRTRDGVRHSCSTFATPEKQTKRKRVFAPPLTSIPHG